MKKVSVIVPIYNVEGYLPQCLDSIVRQSYSHLEILLVDDGSTDGSGRICDEYAARDPRIRVIHKPNGGLSDARNAALDVMTGDLATMVDGDDYISEDCIQVLLEVLEQTQSDIAIGKWVKFAGHGSHAKSRSDNITTYSRDETIKQVFYQNTLTNSACSRLYKASLFDGLRFTVGILYEDLALAYPLLLRAYTVAYTNHTIYYYRMRPSSILGSFNPRRTDVIDIMEDLEHRVAIEAPQFLPAVRSRLLSASFNILLLCPRTPRYAPVTDRCWRNIKRLRMDCFTDRHVRLKNKLGILGSLLGRRLFMSLFSRLY